MKMRLGDDAIERTKHRPSKAKADDHVLPPRPPFADRLADGAVVIGAKGSPGLVPPVIEAVIGLSLCYTACLTS